MKIRETLRNLQNPSKFTIASVTDEDKNSSASIDETENPTAYWNKMRTMIWKYEEANNSSILGYNEKQLAKVCK